jgi:steroid delta-isomerase-like uncharacterized protein
MSTESNKAFIRRLIDEEWNKGNLDAVDQFVASNFVHHDSTNPDITNREAYKQWITATRTAFPDFQVIVDDEIAEGDQVVIRWTVRGTHQGELVTPTGTIPPTGQQVSIPGVTISRCENGQVVEDWHMGDVLGMMFQLGIMS